MLISLLVQVCWELTKLKEHDFEIYFKVIVNFNYYCQYGTVQYVLNPQNRKEPKTETGMKRTGTHENGCKITHISIDIKILLLANYLSIMSVLVEVKMFLLVLYRIYLLLCLIYLCVLFIYSIQRVTRHCVKVNNVLRIRR